MDENGNPIISGGGDGTAGNAAPPSAGDGTEETGGVTPQEVAAALKGSGMRVSTPAAGDAGNNDDGGDDDDDESGAAGNEGTPGAGTPPTGGGPAAKPALPAADPKPPIQPAAPVEAPVAKEFSMTITDEAGVTFKIKAGDNIDQALADADLSSSAKIMQILHDFNNLEAEKKAYDSEQSEAEAANARDETIKQLQEGWKTEIQDLQADKRMPADEKERTAREQAVYAHMGKVNGDRAAKSQPGISSFEDALNSLEVLEAKEARIAAAKEAKETSRRNGALVGGSSAPASAPGQIQPYRANSGARNATEALKRQKLL